MGDQIVHTQTTDIGTVAVTFQQKARVLMQIAVSLISLSVGLVVLTSPNLVMPTASDDGTKKLAAGWVGAVIGYWLS
jgi:hypothetical protein